MVDASYLIITDVAEKNLEEFRFDERLMDPRIQTGKPEQI